MRTVSCNKKSVPQDLPEVHFMLSISLFINLAAFLSTIDLPVPD